MTRRLRHLVAPFALAASACVATDATAASGRTDRLSGAPFFVTYKASSGSIVVFPVTVDPDSGQPFNMAGRESAIRPLLDALNEALAANPCCRYVASPALPSSGGPVVYLGMLDGENAPSGTGFEQEEYEEYSPMILHSLRPEAGWRSAAAAIAAQHEAARILVVQLAFTQFPKADQGFFGKKVVLGTGHEIPIRFLSAVDSPVEVVALTAVLLDTNGNLLRAGGEGIAGYDAPFRVQVFEAGKDVDTSSIERLLTEERREDLPGRPLKWRAALDQLVAQATAAR